MSFRLAILGAVCTAGLLTASLKRAEAVLATYTSDFADGNLNAPLPEGPFTVPLIPLTYSPVPTASFSVVPSTSNTVPAGDSVTFSGNFDGSGSVFNPNGSGFIRGTGAPASVPGLATMIYVGTLPPAGAMAPTYTISFDTAFPVTQIRLSIADLEVAGANPATEMVFSSGASAGLPTSATNDLDLTAGTVTTTSSTNGFQGEIVWDFASPIADPTITFDYNEAFLLDETHFTSMSYTVFIPEPSIALVGSMMTGMLGFCLNRRGDRDEA